MRSDAVDAVIVLGIVGIGSGRQRIIETASRIHAANGEDVALRELGEFEDFGSREAAFIRRIGELMNRYQKPIINVSFTPVEQAVFDADGPYSAVILPSPLRSVRVIAKMACYRAFLDSVGADGRR